MKLLLWAGVLVLALGFASLLVPIPRTESQGIRSGNVNIGIQTRHDEKVSPIISAVLIIGGVGMMIAGARGR